ncbi:hypothetical protein [Streptomyces sp. NPDC086147]|uniref:hypothetical protein n=1 Tax=Streptomyces sp. NPDC086147 TaxID=3155295 RepID=UPI00344C0434
MHVADAPEAWSGHSCRAILESPKGEPPRTGIRTRENTMKLFRFMCAAALTASMVGAGVGALFPAPEPVTAVAADGKSVRISAESTERCEKPGDTEWSAPASVCPKDLL